MTRVLIQTTLPGRWIKLRSRGGLAPGALTGVYARFVMVLALMALLAAAFSSSASARIFELTPADETETPTFSFTDDQALIAIGRSDLLGGQICVVSAATTDPGNGSLDCDQPAWGTPNQVIGLGTFIIPIEGPTLRVGSWRLLGDGGPLPGQDDLSEPFTISPCTQCDPRIGAGAIAAYKDTARAMMPPMDNMCEWFNYMDLAGDVASGLRSGAALAEDVVDSLPRYGALVDVPIGGAFGFGLLTINNAILEVPTSRLSAYTLLMRAVSCRTKDMYADIAADPPDPNYDSVASPQFGHLPSVQNSLVDDLATSTDAQRALGAAQLTAFERYQAAAADGDEAAVQLQSQAIAGYGYELRDEMRLGAGLMRDWSDELALESGINTATIDSGDPAIDAIAAAEARLRSSGFTAAEVSELQAGGLTAEEIADLRQELERADVTTAPTGVTIPNLLDTAADALDQQSLEIELFAREAEAVAARIGSVTPPDTTIDTGPAEGSTTNDNDPSFTFSSSEANSTFECKLDDGPFEPCSTPKDYADLPDGEHTFSVRAIDDSNNVDPTPESRTFTVEADIHPPETTISSGPAEGGTVATFRALFEFNSSEDGSTFECEFDDSGFGPCHYSGYLTPSLTNGPHTFRARAVDEVGNVDPSPASRSFTAAVWREIASVGPLEHIYLGHDLSCQVDLIDDTHYSFFPPDVQPGDCGTMLAAGGTVYTPDFFNHAGSAAHPNIRLGVPFTPVSQGPVTGNGSAVDPYTVVTTVRAGTTGLHVTQTDTYVTGDRFYRTKVEVHNTGPAPQTAELYHAADCFLGGSDRSSGYFVTATGGIFCAENPDNSPAGRLIGFVPQESGTTYQEDHYATVWEATDGTPYSSTCACASVADSGAGLNWSLAIPAGESVTRNLLTTIDTTGDVLPPDTTITDGPLEGSTVSDTTPAFGFTSSDPGSTFECRIVGETSYTGCASPFTSGSLADGQYTFEVRATDPSGNTDPSPATRTWTIETTPVDTDAPDTTIDTGPAEGSTTNDNDPSFTFSSSEANSTFECKLDDGPFEPCSTPKDYADLPDGEHTFSVRAIDASNNVDPTPATRTWTIETGPVDTEPPDTIIDSPPHGTTADSTPTFAFHSTEPNSSFECSIDTGTPSFGPCSGPGASHTPASALADGSYTFRVRATDEAGNTDESPATEAFTVLTATPENCPGAEQTYTGTKGKDEITGTAANDLILGLAGHDTLSGANGDDCVIGANGDDTVNGGNGNDLVTGGDRKDIIRGGSGDDKLRAIDGASDVVNCGSGNDKAWVDGHDKVNKDCETVRT